MIRINKLLAAWLGLGFMVFQVHGQSLQEALAADGVQAPPVFGVADVEGFFNRNAGALQRISDQIRRLDHDHGYMIYLVVEPVMMAATAPERATQLRNEWIPDGNGLVLVFESDSRSLGIGRDLVGDLTASGKPVLVPSNETVAIITQAVNATDSRLAPEVYLETLVGKLTSGFDDYFKRRATPPPAGRTLKIGLLVSGIVALLGLGAIGLGGLIRHSRVTEVRSFRFPAANLPERLGAPCGANVTARRFAPQIPLPPLPA